MVGKLVLTLIAFQLCLCLVQSQGVTEKDDEPVWKYACGQSVITCRYGFIVDILEARRGRVDGECALDTVTSATKYCERSVSQAQSDIQGDFCFNRTVCTMIDYTGYDVCFDGLGNANYGAVRYVCRFGGYEGRSSPPTTTTTTTPQPTTTTTTPQPTTTLQPTTTTKPPSTTEKLTSKPPIPDETTTGPDGNATTNPTEPDTTGTTRSLTTAPTGQATGLAEEEKTKLIIGVSVGAVVLILIIIVLVECKRQTRKRRYKEEQTPDILADKDTNHIIQPVTAEERAMVTEHKVEYTDETNAVKGERERKFRKRSETNNGFEEEITAGEVETKSAEQSAESQNKGHFTGHRDSGVSTLMAEEANGDSPGDGYENSEELENNPTPPESPPPKPESPPARHVSFSDMAVNTDRLGLISTENVYDNPSGGQTNLHRHSGNPHLDPNVSGPASEGEVLY